MKKQQANIVIGWLHACSPTQRKRLTALLRLTPEIAGQTILDTMAARLLAECAVDLDMRSEEFASLVGDARRVGREAVLELALAGIQWSRAA